MMTPIPPVPPFRVRGVTMVRGLGPLHLVDWLPSWGGPASAAWI